MKSWLAIPAVAMLGLAGCEAAKESAPQKSAAKETAQQTAEPTPAEALAEWMAVIQSMGERKRLVVPVESEDPDMRQKRRWIEYMLRNAAAAEAAKQPSPPWRAGEAYKLSMSMGEFVVSYDVRGAGFVDYYSYSFDPRTGAYMHYSKMHADY